MSNKEPKKNSKLNEIDKRVLMSYANMSLETGAKVTTEATEITALHKDMGMKL